MVFLLVHLHVSIDLAELEASAFVFLRVFQKEFIRCFPLSVFAIEIF